MYVFQWNPFCVLAFVLSLICLLVCLCRYIKFVGLKLEGLDLEDVCFAGVREGTAFVICVEETFGVWEF